MSNLDALREELANSHVRGMSLGGWPEGPELRDCGSLIGSSISSLELLPAKARIYHHIMESSLARKWSTPSDVDLSESKKIVKVSIDVGKPLSKTNLRSRLGLFSIRAREGSYAGSMYFQHATDLLSVERGLKVISAWLDVITPTFGFSSVGPERTTALFHAGQPASSMDELYLKRIEAHEAVRHCKPHEDDYMGKRLLDVFELNILSPDHLATRIFGGSLENWITRGDRGTLTELKKGVYAWIVPDSLRLDVRQSLLSARVLIVPV